MRTQTVYYAEGVNQTFYDEASALRAEQEHQKLVDLWKTNSVPAKLDKLIFDIKKCQDLAPGIIATCSYDTIRLKGMCRVCNEFYEQNKECLKYY